jgi:hypothetical protein
MTIRLEDIMNSLPEDEQNKIRERTALLLSLPPLTPEGIVAYAEQNGISLNRLCGWANFPELCARHLMVYSVIGRIYGWEDRYNLDTADAYGITLHQLRCIDYGFEGCEYYEDYDLEYWELGKKIYDLSKARKLA